MTSTTNHKATKTPKGEQSRALILNTALDLLQQHGYEKTTMRAIARPCPVPLMRCCCTALTQTLQWIVSSRRAAGT